MVYAMTNQPIDEEPDFNAPVEPVIPSRTRPWMAAISILLIFVIVVTGLAGFGLMLLRGGPEVTVTFSSPAPSGGSTNFEAAAARLAVIDGDGRLVTMDAIGGSIAYHDLTGVRFSFPAWSPDGSHIAATGAGPDGYGVYVVPIAPAAGAGAGSSPPTNEPTAIYLSQVLPAFYLYWMPNGRSVAFLTSQPSGLIDLRVAPADASAEATVVRRGAPMYWAWIDEARMLVHAGGGSASFLGEVGPDGEPPTGAPDPIDGAGDFRAPAVSADGRFRAYVGRGTDRTAAVIVEPLDPAPGSDASAGRTEAKVLGPAALDFDPGGDRLAFVARATAGSSAPLPVGPLRLIDAVSGEVRTLLTGTVVGFFWSPDGRMIAALRVAASGTDGTAAAGAPGGIREASVRMTDAGRAGSVAVAPAAPGIDLQLVFIDPSNSRIRSQRSVRVADVFANQVLPYFDQYALSHRVWSSDGASIALPVVAADGSSEIRVFPAAGTSDARIAAGVAAFWRP
jgi:TolB protein